MQGRISEHQDSLCISLCLVLSFHFFVPISVLPTSANLDVPLTQAALKKKAKLNLRHNASSSYRFCEKGLIGGPLHSST